MTELKSYSERRSWSDQHLQAVKSALGKKFFAVANLEQDTRMGFDLYCPALNIAVRIRQLKYQNYMDFTIRTSGGGKRSEYAKLLDKNLKIDYLCYAFALDKNTLAAAYLIDLHQWKVSLMHGEVRPQFRRNKDGSHFVAFPFYNVTKQSRQLGKQHYIEQII